MRIASWNVNSIKARLNFVLHWLDAREPDVVCMQELKVTEDSFPREDFEQRGYHCYIHGQPTWNGVAVLTRKPAKVTRAGLVGAEHAGARLLTVQQGDMSITSVYVPNGKSLQHDDFRLKLQFMRALASYVGESIDADGRAIIGGDFNIVHRDIDSCDPKRLAGEMFHTDAERDAIDRLLDLGFSDLYRELNPEGTMFSWWDYRAGSFHKNQGLRIDLLLASRPLLELTTEVWIDRDYRKKKEGEKPSDHAPVIAELGE